MYVFGISDTCRIQTELSPHPPLGKWLIAAGIRIFGYRSGGWRVASLVAGTLTVVLVYLLARRLMHSLPAAVVSSGALAVDFLHFVHSRIAMLDVFLTMFVVAAFLFAVLDVEARNRDVPRRGRSLRENIWARRWRLAAGGAAGAAVATKWAGVPILLAIIGFTLVREVEAEARRSGERGSLLLTIKQESLSMVAGFVLLPAAIYMVSYLGRIDGSLLSWPWAEGAWIRQFIHRQVEMAQFHAAAADSPHLYASPAWSWPLLKRPVLYFFQSPGNRYQVILALGSPLVWSASLGGLLYTAVRWIKGSRASGEGVILLAFLASWVPWILLSVSRTYMFLFYFLPAVPFMGMSLGYVLLDLWRVRSVLARGIVAIVCVGALSAFVFYYPVLGAVPIDRESWETRVLFRDCGRIPEGTGASPAPVASITPGEQPDAPGAYPEAFLREGEPPSGWCWI